MKLLTYILLILLPSAFMAMEPETDLGSLLECAENNDSQQPLFTIDNYMQILDSHAKLPQESKEFADSVVTTDNNFAPKLDYAQLEKPQQYQCQLCPFCFKNKQELKNHNEQQHNIHECDQENCDRSFSSKADLKRHFTRIHKLKNSSQYKCNINQCNEIFTTKEDLIIHQTTRHNKKKLIPYTAFWNLKKDTVSDFTEKAPETAYNLSSPPTALITAQENKILNCNHCDKKYKNAAAFRGHKKKYHSEFFMFTCEHCGEKCETDASLKNHCTRNHNPEYLAKKIDSFSYNFHLNKTDNDAQQTKRQKTA